MWTKKPSLSWMTGACGAVPAKAEPAASSMAVANRKFFISVTSVGVVAARPPLGHFDGKDQGWRPAACRIRSATSSAWETSDRWLDGNSMVLAPMRLARKRCRSGLMVWSLLETAYQDGLSCQAAAWVRAENRVLAMGCCTA